MGCHLRSCLILIILSCFTAVKAEYMRYKDPSHPINARIDDLMKRMTLSEKIGQMTQIERQVASADVMKNYFIGNIFLDFSIYQLPLNAYVHVCIRDFCPCYFGP